MSVATGRFRGCEFEVMKGRKRREISQLLSESKFRDLALDGGAECNRIGN